MPKKILFICTGNSCRSVMAKALLKKMIKDSDRLDPEQFKICSAGTNPIEGMHPPKETVSVLLNEGIDVSSYEAKRVTPEMVNEFDMILAMQKYHKDIIQSMAEDKDKVFLLKEFCSDNIKGKELDLSDPIGSPLEVYEECFLTIKDCLKKIVDNL